jgi:hypothetical protein
MLQTVSRLFPELPLFLMTAVATHLVMSFAQTLMHYKLGHHPIGGKLFRNHINFHHTYYSKDHLVSRTYLGDEGNNTPFFFIPVFLVGACTYPLLPFDLFVVWPAAGSADTELRCHDGTGGRSWRGGSLHASSSLRRCG